MESSTPSTFALAASASCSLTCPIIRDLSNLPSLAHFTVGRYFHLLYADHYRGYLSVAGGRLDHYLGGHHFIYPAWRFASMLEYCHTLSSFSHPCQSIVRQSHQGSTCSLYFHGRNVYQLVGSFLDTLFMAIAPFSSFVALLTTIL